jgi:DNA-binding winged helix-turn-helix (wHTH) protein
VSRSRYVFGGFVLSRARRCLVREGREVALIPRYLDLLLLLVERRHEAVHRREIFDAVWSDVVVSDGALSQAVRSLRRALGDDPREPVFIRTVSRHGYRFVHPQVVEEPDDGGSAPPPGPAAPMASVRAAADPFEAALEGLLATAEALLRLDRRPGHEAARALLRDARWDVPGAGEVPFLGQPGSVKAAGALLWLRLRRALRAASGRWAAAMSGGAAAGILAGILGGVLLCLALLAVVGAAIGGAGAAGVGAGLAAAEACFRSARGLALAVFGALGGGLVGALAHVCGRWTLEGLFGHPLSAVGGGVEGLVIGGAAGLGYALSTPRPSGGMATPRGRARLQAALVTGLSCALGAVLLTAAGGHLGGVSLDHMARSFQGSQVGLAPLARLFGEDELGPVTRTLLSVWEGLLFGCGLVLGLTRRPT